MGVWTLLILRTLYTLRPVVYRVLALGTFFTLLISLGTLPESNIGPLEKVRHNIPPLRVCRGPSERLNSSERKSQTPPVLPILRSLLWVPPLSPPTLHETLHVT